MKERMKAIVLSNGVLSVQNVERPQVPAKGHLVIEMMVSAINNGDKFFLTRPTPPGMPKSLYDIRGVSGVGRVLDMGDRVPEMYKGKTVAIYRSLHYSEQVVGTWSEYSHVPYLDCVILPDDIRPEDYSGSLVNAITPFGFLKQVIADGHQGIVSTAGGSATGKAMLGFCLAYNFPLLSIVRSEESKQELESLGAKHVVVQSSAAFDQELSEKAGTLKTTAVFDGVGGQILNKIIGSLPYGSVIYSYGYIGDATPLTIPMSTVALKNLTIKPFMNISSDTVRQPDRLEEALKEIGQLIHQPHFKTKLGMRFSMQEINEALSYQGANGEKPVLVLR
jgi:NADPH:quinone reductase-like Zn-dependent oxidoreductase